MLRSGRGEEVSYKPRERRSRFFHHYLKIVREERQITQGALSLSTGIPQGELSKWENGLLVDMPPDKMRAIARGLGISPGDLGLAYVGIDPRGYIYPKVSPQFLSPPMMELLARGPDEREVGYLLATLESLRTFSGIADHAHPDTLAMTGTEDVRPQRESEDGPDAAPDDTVPPDESAPDAALG